MYFRFYEDYCGKQSLEHFFNVLVSQINTTLNFLHNLSLDFPVEDFTYENDIYRVCERNVHEIVGAGKRVKTLHLF